MKLEVEPTNNTEQLQSFCSKVLLHLDSRFPNHGIDLTKAIATIKLLGAAKVVEILNSPKTQNFDAVGVFNTQKISQLEERTKIEPRSNLTPSRCHHDTDFESSFENSSLSAREAKTNEEWSYLSDLGKEYMIDWMKLNREHLDTQMPARLVTRAIDGIRENFSRNANFLVRCSINYMREDAFGFAKNRIKAVFPEQAIPASLSNVLKGKM